MSEGVVVDEPAEITPGYGAPTCRVAGPARSHRFAPVGYPLWLLHAVFDGDAELVWDGDHGDEALFVVDGRLDHDGSACRGDGAIVIESGAPARVFATSGTAVVHVGSAAPVAPTDGLFGAPAPAGHTVHVVNHADAHRVVYDDHPIEHHGFADSRCRTCRINLFEVDGAAGYRTPSHVHSQDEIIHVLRGELRVGPHRLRAGASIAVPAHTRYGFAATEEFAFLNYRRDVSWSMTKPGTPAMLEGDWPDWVPASRRVLTGAVGMDAAVAGAARTRP